jgi:hypothetical protein
METIYNVVDGKYFLNGKEVDFDYIDRKDEFLVVDEGGTKRWYLNDKLHRENGPAIEYTYGDKEWYLNGKYHREDGPACEYVNGYKSWYINGKRHREDGPAIEKADGTKEWFLNNKVVYSDHVNNTDQYKISQDMKKSIIKYKLSKIAT